MSTGLVCILQPLTSCFHQYVFYDTAAVKELFVCCALLCDYKRQWEEQSSWACSIA